MTDTDYEQLVEIVRTQSADAPGSDTERVTIRSLEEVSDESLRELMEAFLATGGDVDPDELVFVLSPSNVDRVLERAAVDDLESLSSELGHEIAAEEEMPDDAVLFVHPDAFDGAELLEPELIACGTLGKAT